MLQLGYSACIYDQNMKIALIHHQFIRGGGTERYLADLVRGFSDAGDTVTVIASKIADDIPEGRLCSVIKNDVSIIPKPLRKPVFATQLRRIMREHDFDLTISVTRTVSQDIVVSGGTRRGYLAYQKQRGNIFDNLEINLEQEGFDTSQWIVAHSKMVRDDIIKQYKVDEEKIRVIYPPINLDIFNTTVRERRKIIQKEFRIDPNRKTLLFPSTGHHRKGLGLLIEAMKLLRDDAYELLIAGSPADEFRLPANSRALGYVDDIAGLYGAVDLTVLPSQYEPFGLIAVESVCCGTPVVLSPYVAAAEVLHPDERIIIERLDAESIADAIVTAASHSWPHGLPAADKAQLSLAGHIEALKNLVR